ncbi:hypothetical protein KFE25_009236 [Diacronema lutheri]|uniref:Calponin-homology (CH) domain-containing protein n=1 Tax=Diacronema lutheri TaxID=2081491 RepID=A0A8J5Y3F3_DIALT|nr:hypothetical protein KFE25_009236 [Diacronema lutheri]
MACDLSAAGTNAWELATRRELVQWIRGKYQPNFQRLEDLSTGAVYCQVLDSVYPGAVALERVKWNAAGEKERLTNFQVLQAGLERAKLTKHVPVDSLLRPSVSAHLEFSQWLKVVHDRRLIAGVPEYDAAGRLDQVGAKLRPASDGASAGPGLEPPVSMRRSKLRTPSPSSPLPGRGSSWAASAVATSASRSCAQAPVSATSSDHSAEEGAMRQVEQLRRAHAKAERQRDFYFGKLCDIEMYADATAAENDALDVVEQVVAILRLGQDEPRPGSSGRRDVPRIAPTHASQSRVSDGSHSQAESAVSSASVVPILPLDDKWHHALESARLREKVATARQSVQEEEARRAASRAFAPGSRARRCTTRLFEAWEVLARVIPCAPASDAPWRERLAATWPRAAAVRPPTAGADSARQAAAPAAGSLRGPPGAERRCSGEAASGTQR